MTGKAAFDPAGDDCFTASPFDWTKTGAELDAACEGANDPASNFDGATVIPTVPSEASAVDEIYLDSLISDFICTGGDLCIIDNNGNTIQEVFHFDKTYYCKINAANTCAGTNYCSNDETITCSCFAKEPVTLAPEAYTTPIMDYFINGCLHESPEDGAPSIPSLGEAHLQCIAKSLATLPSFGPTEARETVFAHIKRDLYANNDFNKLQEIDACFENDAYIKHLTFILNNMSEFESKSSSILTDPAGPIVAECSPDFDESIFNRWDFTGQIDWAINDYTTDGLSKAYQEALLAGWATGNPEFAATDTCTAMVKAEYALQHSLASEFKGECNSITASGSTISFNCPDQDKEDKCTATFGPDFTMDTCLDLGCALTDDSDYVETCNEWATVGRWGWESGPTGYWGYNFFSESLANYCDNKEPTSANYCDAVHCDCQLQRLSTTAAGADDVVNCGLAAEAHVQAGGADGNTSMSAGRQAEILNGVAAAMTGMSPLGSHGNADNDFVKAVTTWFQQNDPYNQHVVDKIMSMDNMAWEGFNFLLQAGGAMMDDGGYAAEGGASGLVGLYDAFSNNGAWDGNWRTGDGNEAVEGENGDTNGWINSDHTWWASTIDGMNWSEDYANKWKTEEAYTTFYNHTFNRMPVVGVGGGSGAGGGNGGGGGSGGGGNVPPSGPVFGTTSPPGALASGIDAAGASKVNGDVIDTWLDCLAVTPGITDGFMAIFDAAMKDSLTDDGSVLACETAGSTLEERIMWAVQAADAADPDVSMTWMWDTYKDPANPLCPGCWEAQLLRVELQLRAFKQWGEDTSVSGFETLEDFCAFDFTTVVTCGDDGTTMGAGELSKRLNELGLPQGIYDALHESDRVDANPSPDTTASTTTPAMVTESKYLRILDFRMNECHYMNKYIILIYTIYK